MNDNEKHLSRRGALGKGISSLLGESSEMPMSPRTTVTSSNPSREHQFVEGQDQIHQIDLKLIDPNPSQPRKIFDEKLIKELASSLKQDGFLQPIIVSKSTIAGRFTIVAGERRWRASHIAGLTKVPVLIKEGTQTDLLRLALIENIQRADLNIIEEAEAYSSLIKELGLTQDQCADRVGKDRSTITNILRLLSLPKEIRDDLTNNKLSMGHGRAILGLEDKKQMLRCREIVLKKHLNVRQTEQLVKTFRQLPNSDKASSANDRIGDSADLQYITDTLRSHLHTKVKITGSSARGKIEISYFSMAELERILRSMGHPL